jgi:hypothetical protein
MTDFSIPVYGMREAVKSFDAAASRIARADTPSPAGGDAVELSESIVALLESRNRFAANANVARAEDQLQQSLLNVLA